MTTGLYFIALLPPERLRKQIRVLKEEVKDRFGSAHALKSPAHITLQPPFRMLSQEEGQLNSVLKQLAGSQNPFHLALQGFDCFPRRVIFIRIKDHKAIFALLEQLQAELTMHPFLGIKKEGHPFHPHMTIASRDLKKPAFVRAWTEFKNRPFQASFEVQSIFLLKHNGQFWDVLSEFNFVKGS